MIVPLAFQPEGTVSKVIRIRGGKGLVRRLMDMGLVPGTEVSMIKSVGFGPILVGVKGTRLAIGKGIAMRVLVRVVE